MTLVNEDEASEQQKECIKLINDMMGAIKKFNNRTNFSNEEIFEIISNAVSNLLANLCVIFFKETVSLSQKIRYLERVLSGAKKYIKMEHEEAGKKRMN